MQHKTPDNPQEWEDHIAVLIAQGHHLEETTVRYHLEHAMAFLPWLLAQQERRVWFAGNGLSLAPLLFASFGCETWATDIAPSAIKMLNVLQTPRWTERMPSLKECLKPYHLPFPPHPPLLLYPRCQDFCQQAPQEDLDLILNFRALQCLSPTQQSQAIAVFFDALREGGRFIAELHHASPQQYAEIDARLRDVGFRLPFSDAARWYQEALQQHGLSPAFFSGLFFSADPAPSNPNSPSPQHFDALRKQYQQKRAEAQQQMDTQGHAKYARLL